MKTTWPKFSLRTKKEAEPEPVTTGRVRPANSSRHQVRGRIQLPPKITVKDFNKPGATSNYREKFEAAAGWPPGSMIVTPDLTDAGYARVKITNPKILRKPVPWQGPSWIGGSIADPISIGMYQDGNECEVIIPETQIQVMGQVGSGKSLGGAWNALGEMITRDDVVIWAIDIKKGMQTLGPLAPALHRLATTPADAIDLLNDANALITPRTNYLSSEGLGKWYRGCGLKYLVVWIEEVPEVMDELGTKGTNLWVKTVRAARSGGITIGWSLQRAGYTQIPTIARGQATKWCFGVQDSKEAGFGLSKIQKDLGCTPELWGQRKPGMSYIDAPNIPESKVSTPIRTWWFGHNDTLISRHAKRHPIEARPYDDLMKDYFAGKSGTATYIDLSGESIEDTESSSPVTSEPERSEGEPTTTAKADLKSALNQKQRGAIGRRMVNDFITVNQGKTIATRDFLDIIETLGLTRPWINLQLNALVKAGKIKKHTKNNTVTWEILPIATD